MKTIINSILTIILGSFIYSCSSPGYTSEPVGNEAEVILKSNKEIKGELLFVKDSSIYFLASEGDVNLSGKNGRIVYANYKDVKSIALTGYSDKSWILAIIGEQIIPGVVLGITAGSVSNNSSTSAFILGGTALVSLLTFLLFESSTTTPEIESGLNETKLNEFRKYFRYPEGITDSQIEELMKVMHQQQINLVK